MSHLEALFSFRQNSKPAVRGERKGRRSGRKSAREEEKERERGKEGQRDGEGRSSPIIHRKREREMVHSRSALSHMMSMTCSRFASSSAHGDRVRESVRASAQARVPVVNLSFSFFFLLPASFCSDSLSNKTPSSIKTSHNQPH